jgi:hypothetical protein
MHLYSIYVQSLIFVFFCIYQEFEQFSILTDQKTPIGLSTQTYTEGKTQTDMGLFTRNMADQEKDII